MTNDTYLKMINLERDQKCLRTYTSFMFEAGQEVHGIYCLLDNTILKPDSCLHHLTKPIVTKEKTYTSSDTVHCIKCDVVHKIFNFLFGGSDT